MVHVRAGMGDAVGADDLAEFVRAGHGAWPGLSVAPEAFRRFVVDRPGAMVAYSGDLYLAFACASGDSAAMRALDPMLRDAAAGAVTRFSWTAALVDELAQALRERLLVSQPPKIASYGGRSSLRTWLGIIALRTAQNLRRRKADDPRLHVGEGGRSTPDSVDVERDYLRARYREHFAGALRKALASLPERERTILRLQLGERLSIDEIAARLEIGRATATRWLRIARERLVDETRERLCEALRITQSDYRSLAAVVRSEIDVSVAKLLETQGD
jgi:RNA polymerase sigma-70 factor (ECF subfamily)